MDTRVTPLDDRAAALHAAREVLTSLDHSPDDLVIVADWILTGCCDAALSLSEQRARNYREFHTNISSDAAT